MIPQIATAKPPVVRVNAVPTLYVVRLAEHAKVAFAMLMASVSAASLAVATESVKMVKSAMAVMWVHKHVNRWALHQVHSPAWKIARHMIPAHATTPANQTALGSSVAQILSAEFPAEHASPGHVTKVNVLNRP